MKGLNHPVKRKKIFSHVRHLKSEIVFLQTHIRNSDNVRLFSGWRGQHFHSSFQAKARGVSIFIGQGVSFESHSVVSDKFGRYVIVCGKLYNSLVALVNVYAPNLDNVVFFEHLLSNLPDLNIYRLILGGDFNFWLDPTLDRSSTNICSISKSASFIKTFLSDYGIRNVWRTLHPSDREYSFFSPVHHTYTRIDYFFIDDQLLPLVNTCTYQSIVISDHAPLVLEISLPDLPHKNRQCRFNSTLLSDDNFVKFVEREINFFFATNITPDVSNLIVWDAFKAYIRGQIISYTVRVKREAGKEREDLSHQIREIDKRYAQTKDPELHKKRLDLKTRFDLLTTHSAEYSLLKQKTLFYVHGDKSDKMMANLLKSSNARQSISNVQLSNGRITSDHMEINKAFRDFYQQLYSSESQADSKEISNFLNSLNILKLSSNSMQKLEEPISQHEIS